MRSRSCSPAEQGKPIRDSHIEAERFADNIEIYAGLVAGGALAGKHVALPAQKAMGLVVRRPIGVVGAIIPWNFPLTLLANKIAPAMAVGNTVVAKPASTTPLSTLRLAELLLEGGLPPGVLNIVTGPGAVVGDEIIRNPLVRKIGFTGETGTGKQVAKAAPMSSSTSRWSWAAATRRSCATMPTSTSRRRTSPSAASSTRARPVWRSSACLWTTTSPTSSSRRSRRGPSGSSSAAAPTRRRRWGRCTPKSSAPRSRRSWPTPSQRGGKVVAGGKRPAGDEFDQGLLLRADGGGRRARRRARLDRGDLRAAAADHAGEGPRRGHRAGQ